VKTTPTEGNEDNKEGMPAGILALGMVHSLLITADDADLLRLEEHICQVANFIKQRGQTSHWTVFDADHQMVAEACRRHNVTLQEIFGAGDNETYSLLWQGKLPAWQPARKGFAA
jgi:hypothetical protein